MLRACAACHRFLPQHIGKSSCSFVFSAARRSLVLVSLGCVCGWVSWPSGHVAHATLWGLWGVGTSFGRGCVLALLVGKGSHVHRVRRSLALRTFVVVGLLRSFKGRAAPIAVVRWGWDSRSRALLAPAVFLLPRRRSFSSLWASAHDAQRPPSCVSSGGAVGLGPCRAASRAAACCVLCGVDMRARVAVWSLGGL